MNTMRWLAVAMVLCGLTAGLRADEKKTDLAKELIGTWEVTNGQPGTVPEGAKMEFTKDGKLKFIIKLNDQERTIDATYTVEGSSFTMVVKVEDEERKQTIDVTEINDKVLKLKDKMSKTVELKRLK